ncbi:MAG TPA: peptidylprolyl isomerase [Thiotrichales bacterium]|nr:peptidylprolyl isomerase [Thiotrichales bacterium]
MQIEDNKVVTIDYTLTNDQGEVLDESKDGSFVYLHGHHNIIPGLEAGLAGKSAGDQLTVQVEPAQAYGERDPSMTQVVPRSMFEEGQEIEVGMQFHAASADGQPIMVTIAAVEGDNITIDGNHPLAGQHLTFQVNVVEVRDATADELAHGHAHSPGGHH